MKIIKCFFCNKVKHTSYQVTEIEKDKTVTTIYMCKKCGQQYISALEPEKPQPPKRDDSVDLTHIQSPEELLAFLNGMSIQPQKKERPPCLKCGMTEAEFDKDGRMGCPECYTHWSDKMEKLVFPFHGSREHFGKLPKRQLLDRAMDDPVEKLKLLKLRYAKALELEEYEKLGELKRQIDELSSQ